MDVTAANGFLRFFNDLPDPRGVNKIHKLHDLIVIAVMAVICGADGWAEVALFGRCKRKWLATFLELPGGIPSHDTFGRVFSLLDPVLLNAAFWHGCRRWWNCAGGGWSRSTARAFGAALSTRGTRAA